MHLVQRQSKIRKPLHDFFYNRAIMSVECFAIHYALRQREGAKSFLSGACHQLHHSISTDEEFLQIWLEPARPQFNLGPRKTDPLTDQPDPDTQYRAGTQPQCAPLGFPHHGRTTG
ncbi:MAG: hypothetical protein E5X00_08230 [Mesorhizobium sp.]|nr:MAG: hypothetical protein E5X00_08230 [Mesorhizobium sp.]